MLTSVASEATFSAWENRTEEKKGQKRDGRKKDDKNGRKLKKKGESKEN
jgi:hypothetical protein